MTGPRRWKLCVAAVALSFGVAACGGSSADARPVTDRLGRLPATLLDGRGDAEFRIIDVAAAADAADVSVTAALVADQGSGGLGLPPSWLFPDGWDDDPGAMIDELGWVLTDATGSVEYATPPAVVAVAAIDAATSVLDRAIGPADDDGIWWLGPAEDMTLDESGATPLRRFGETLRLAEVEGAVAVTRSVETLSSVRSASDAGSVLENEVVAELATALDDAGTYGAVIVVGNRAADNGLAPDAFDGLAVGVAGPADGRITMLVFRHRDADAARSHAEALEPVLEQRPFARDFASVAVAADETLLTVTMRHDDATPVGSGFALVATGDPVTMHR